MEEKVAQAMFVDDKDDRQNCGSCSHYKSVKRKFSVPLDQWDRIVRINHPGNQWMFPLAVIGNGWASVTYDTHECYGGEPDPFPQELMHRCRFYESTQEQDIQNKPVAKEWWEE